MRWNGPPRGPGNLSRYRPPLFFLRHTATCARSWADFKYPPVQGDGFGICQYDRK